MTPLTDKEKNLLLALARSTIEAKVEGRPLPAPPKAEGVLASECGAFVTIHKKGRLRGCIGNMIGEGPLVRTIQEMAVASATEDPRFNGVKPEELKDLDIEISVLSPMKKVIDVNEIEVGKHGIIMRQGWRSGVLLPQVATEQGWEREEFLVNTCYKAGLPPDAWKDPKTVIEIFSAEVFGD
ncbi:MAG: AMMECR1 domain-containing protein [Deltaproteobacteria bacterium CG11_big_fil_rev_8_21_14_0_20_49_13]|nr:MAG: AMMECR1 domain-containing protein [Deltaproteobacteria bacterium CG11_big_fil_rev_8_21_14_0_20_49_13]